MRVPDLPRPELSDTLLARARRGAPLLLTGPPGAGKTTLLLELREALERGGWIAVYLDLMGAASSPERFVATALEALPAAAFGSHLARATEIRRLAAAGRAHGVEAVRALFALWTSLDEAGGRPVALLLDEATEIRSLAYFGGLRRVDAALGAALAARPRGTILATSYPTLAGRFWRFDTLEATPLTPEALTPLAASAGLSLDPAAVVAASFGWPRYVRILLEALAPGEALESAWASEMAPGGRLEAACRATHEALLLRSRGYGMSKAVLAAVAAEEGLNLTALVGRLGRTPGAVRDYLQWLVDVDALRMVRKRYFYVDGLLRVWVRLHAGGLPATEAQIQDAARELAGRAAGPAPAEPVRESSPAPPARRDSLIEID